MTNRSLDCSILERLEQAIAERQGADPTGSYVAQLAQGDSSELLKKIGEEATEVILASVNDGAENSLALCEETADLLFHLLVLLARHGTGLAQVLAVLERREGVSGLQEKQLRSPGNTR